MKKAAVQFLFGSSTGNNKTFNLAYLLFRLHIGLSIAIHAGFPKMKDIAAPGWFSEQVAGLGFTFPSPQFWAMAASWGEFVGGLMLALGLFTRVASIQLAFQFLIIAFVWYDKPEFLTGMYFQQLYFWCYLLCSVAGGGKFSVDSLINRKFRLSWSPLVKPAFAIFLIMICSCESKAQNPAMQQEDLQKMAGRWKGELIYKDYQNGKEVAIPCNLSVSLEDGMKLVKMGYEYPGEESHNSTDILRISSNGTMIDNGKLISRTTDARGNVRLIIESSGEDDNQPAEIKHIVDISDTVFTLTKMVRYNKSGETVQRNQYAWKRS